MGQAPPPHYRPPRPARGHLVPVGRVLIGRPYDGRPKTDATWSKPGTGHYDPDQAGWWAQQPHRRRAAIAWAVPGAIVFCGYGWLTDSVAVRGVEWLAAWFAIVWGLWTMHYETQRWMPRKRWTEPIHQVIYSDLDIPRKRRAADYIHVPRDGSHIHNPDKPIVVTLPEALALPEGNSRAKIAHKIAEAGGIMADKGQFFAHWEMDLQPRTLTVACNPQPPDLVRFDQIVDHWREAAPDEIVFGLSHEGKPVKRSLNMDAPHILLSVGPGGGKTEFCCSVALQRLARGARVIYLDIVKKGFSAKWAKYIQGIETIRQVDVAYNTLLWLYDETQRRGKIGYEDDSGTYAPGEIFVIFDEANSGFAELKRYEKQLRRDDKDAPSAIAAYERIGQVGREPRVHLLTVTQKGSHRGTGGGDIRDSHGIVCASRFNPRVGRMLFDGIGDGTKASLPRSSDHPGRLQVTSGVGVDECQGVLLIDKPPQKQLLKGPAEFVAAAVLALDDLVRPGITAVRDTGDTARRLASVPDRGPDTEPDIVDAEVVAEQPAEPEPGPEMVTLREAAKRLGTTVGALRNYRGKEDTKGEFPKPVKRDRRRGDQFSWAEIKRFMANRPMAGAK